MSKKEEINTTGNLPENPEAKPKPGLKDYIKRLMPLIKTFVLWFAMISVVRLPGIKEPFKNFILDFTTSSTVLLGKILQIPILRMDLNSIQVDGFPMQIIVECTAYNFYFFAFALALFAVWSWKDKLINLLIFFVVIFFANNVRFFAMGYIGRYYPEFFDTTHDYIWNILFGFMVFGLWAWRDRKCNLYFKKMKKASDETKENN